MSPLQAAITNQDNSLNTSSNPAGRGSSIAIYGTGFGAVDSSSVVTTPVTAVINGITLVPSFVGLSSSTPGLYQVTVPLPTSLPPGLSLPLYLSQEGVTSNAVTVAVQ